QTAVGEKKQRLRPLLLRPCDYGLAKERTQAAPLMARSNGHLGELESMAWSLDRGHSANGSVAIKGKEYLASKVDDGGLGIGKDLQVSSLNVKVLLDPRPIERSERGCKLWLE
ncbi:MAG: hypothetical protein NTW72_13680, partial [Gemmatimonadetes bacterium]|nr:hypothetical protein [Gemmatimonadota bacterium]